MSDRRRAEAVRDACVHAAMEAYEDGGIRGLCAEGRWELAVTAMRALDVAQSTHSIASNVARAAGRTGALPRSAGDGLRRLEPADAAPWLALRLRGLREKPRSFLVTVDEDAALGVDAVAERLARPPDEAFVLGAEVGGALVGSVGVLRAPRHKMKHRAMLWGLYVAPEHRGAGHGRALMDQAIRGTRAMPGVETLALSVDAQNEAARALYLSLGFVTWGIEPDAFRAGDERVDEEHMLLSLTSSS